MYFNIYFIFHLVILPTRGKINNTLLRIGFKRLNVVKNVNKIALYDIIPVSTFIL